MTNFLNPQEVIDKLKLSKTMVAADFGCGSGGWVLPLARKLKEGKVYAIDVLSYPLSILDQKSIREKFFNIKTISSDIESKKGSALASNSLDLVLMTNLLFQAKNRKNVLEEGKRVLKEGGKLLVVDWKEDASPGPEERISSKEVKKIAEEIDFKLETEFSSGNYHYCLLFSK